jgi:hypothetical protein
LSETDPHDEYLELCALSTAGELSEEEQKSLERHLAVCASCRKALRQYQALVDEGISGVGASRLEEMGETDPGPGWSEEAAEKAFRQQWGRKGRPGPTRGEGEAFEFPGLQPPMPAPAGETSWEHVWLLYAAGVLLFISLGVYAYRVRGYRTVPPGVTPPLTETTQNQTALEQQLSEVGHERQLARSEVAQRDHLIADLRRQLAEESTVIGKLQASQQQLEANLHQSAANSQDLVQQGTELHQQLATAQNDSHTLETRIDSLVQQSSEDAARARTLEARNQELTQLLEDRETSLERQEQLLSHDRDIRDLMGARDLYIAEVYDVAGDGETKKPYGRVFYTRGKSLIFYAYDLDQQKGATNAKTFQAWGRRGPDRQQALNLGVFYADNLSSKRWILKCEDAKTLAEIDGVFVTLEPTGGSHAPSGKSLLFASLQIKPNHP